MQRSVRENIALPFVARDPRAGVRSTSARSGKQVDDARSSTLQIDTRARREVRRLSGGNQQKVTIARWVAGGVRTMLCFDPTRGIDIRTKHQIYLLLRDLAEAGAAVLLYTSELKEIQLACDRAIVIFGGRVVAEMAAADADEPTLLRAAYNLKPDAAMPEEVAAEARRGRRTAAAAETGRDGTHRRERPHDGRSEPVDAPRARRLDAVADWARRNAWTLGLLGFLVVLLVFTKLIQPTYGVTRHPGPGDLGAAAGAGGGRAGDRRHLRRHRPVDRLDDGADQRRRGGR